MSKCYLFVSAQYLPTVGGVERFTNSLSIKLQEQGYRTVVVTSALPGLPEYETAQDGTEIFRFPSWLLMNGRLPVLKPGSRLHALSKQLWSNHFDGCIINTYYYPLSMYAARQASLRRIPAILINHSSQWVLSGSPLLKLAGQIYERCAAGFIHHYCRRFFGVSEMARDWVKIFHIQPEGIITNAIDPVQVASQANSSLNWKQELGLPESARIIAFVSRMIPEKGADVLMEAMARIRMEIPEAVLLMAGPGPMYDSMKDRSPEGVWLLGPQAYDRVLALFRQADLFCFPTRYGEGFPCTVLEAAALGCPIITTNTGGTAQLLPSTDYGILLSRADSQEIAAQCIQALEDEDWREKAARLANQRLRENYTWDCSLRQLLEAFETQ